MRWQLNTNIKALSDKENNLLRIEKWRVCQNINKFISGVAGCKGSDDVDVVFFFFLKVVFVFLNDL